MSHKSAIVTGGTKGLGRFISFGLAQTGYRVIALYGHDDSAAEEFKTIAGQKNLEVMTAKVDLQKLDAIEEFFKQVETAAPLEILVNNASPTYFPTHFHKWTQAEMDASWQVNVRAAVRLSQLAIPMMKKTGRGRIVNVLSSNVLGNPSTGSSGYTIAKYGLLGMNKMLAAEYSKFNITSNAVSPAAMDCGIFLSWPESLQEMIRSHTPNQKVLSAEKIAEVIQFLVSPACDGMNGANIALTDGAVVQ